MTHSHALLSTRYYFYTPWFLVLFAFMKFLPYVFYMMDDPSITKAMVQNKQYLNSDVKERIKNNKGAISQWKALMQTCRPRQLYKAHLMLKDTQV